MTNPGPQPPPQQVPVGIEATESSGLGRPIGMPMMVEFAPGQQFLLRPGQNQFWLPPGYYRAQLWSQYVAWQVGKAVIDIDTTRGPVLFYYAAPHTIYQRGAVGFTPQRRRGESFSTALTMVLLALMAVTVVVGIIAVVTASG